MRRLGEVVQRESSAIKERAMSNVRRKALRSLATRRRYERWLTGFSAIVVVPFVCAIVGAFTPDLNRLVGPAAVVGLWVILLIVLAALAIRVSPTSESLLELAVDNEEQERQIATLTDGESELAAIVDRLALEANYSVSVRSAILTFARQGIRTIAALETAVHDLASPLHIEGEFIFGLGPNEAWSFAVYLYSAERDLLLPIWRRKSSIHKSPRGDLGRAWGRGEGHVGKAFVDRRTIITGDAQHPDAEPFSAVPSEKARDYDKLSYRSFASVPIGPLLAEDQRPYGVLVATSDRIGRFGRDNTGILTQIAGAIASFLITGGINVDELKFDETG